MVIYSSVGDDMSDVMASNDENLTEIIKKSDDIILEVGNNFTTMSDLFDNISSVLEGDLSDSIVSKFSEFKDKFATILDNFNSYSSDVTNIRDNHVEEDNSSSTSAVTIDEGGDIINVNRY